MPTSPPHAPRCCRQSSSPDRPDLRAMCCSISSARRPPAWHSALRWRRRFSTAAACTARLISRPRRSASWSRFTGGRSSQHWPTSKARWPSAAAPSNRPFCRRRSSSKRGARWVSRKSVTAKVLTICSSCSTRSARCSWPRISCANPPGATAGLGRPVQGARRRPAA